MYSKYNDVIGVDVSKNSLEYYVSGLVNGTVSNSDSGCQKLLKLCKKHKVKRAVFESTGGYERLLSEHFEQGRFEYAQVHPNRVRHFGYAKGILAKTDPIDAKLLHSYGVCMTPQSTTIPSKEHQLLISQVTRRKQLVEMRGKEKARLKSPLITKENEQCATELISILSQQIQKAEHEIEIIVTAASFEKKYKCLKSFTGIGTTCAATLLAFLPEIGSLSRERIAAIVGVAPYNKESGKSQKPRSIHGGRKIIRDTLYPATIVAITHNFAIRQQYQRLRSRNKTHKVAVIACMRKMLITLNAMIREQAEWNEIRFRTDKKNFIQYKQKNNLAA